MSIRDWPESEQPREKLLTRGPEALSDAELLAVFLRTGTRGKPVLELSRELLQRHDGLRGLMEAPADALGRSKGLGKAKLAGLQAVLELGRRYLAARLERGSAMNSPQDVKDLLLAHLQGLRREVFCCLFLDKQHRLIRLEELFQGTIDGASVHPREVVRRALEHNAAAVILAHNHPSGVAEPSQADQAITRRLVQALGLVDIPVLDHLVIGNACATSFAERGLL